MFLVRNILIKVLKGKTTNCQSTFLINEGFRKGRENGRSVLQALVRLLLAVVLRAITIICQRSSVGAYESIKGEDTRGRVSYRLLTSVIDIGLVPSMKGLPARTDKVGNINEGEGNSPLKEA